MEGSMNRFSILLDLKCAELKIPQLSDSSRTSIICQFDTLSVAQRRETARKIRKLSKKAIQALFKGDARRWAMIDCGFLLPPDALHRHPRFLIERNRINIVRTFLATEISASLHTSPEQSCSDV
jgi:hypothetical protein